MAAMSGKKYQEENNGRHKKWVNQRVPPIYTAWRSKIPVVCYADPSCHGRFQNSNPIQPIPIFLYINRKNVHLFDTYMSYHKIWPIVKCSEWPKLHFHIRPKPKAEDRKLFGLWPNTEAECWNFLKLLSICHICSFNLIFAYPFLMITFLIHKDTTLIRKFIFLPIRGGVIED